MNSKHLISLAEQYASLSNTHNLDDSMFLFSEGAHYLSPFIGETKGKAAIQNIMQNFFLSIPDVHWKTNSYHLTQPHTVRFNFEMNGTDKATGEFIARSDIEEIEFDAQGLINSVKVGSSIILN